MRIVFLDTVGLIGLWDKSDQWHTKASAAYEALSQSPFIAVTTPLVLYECANAASRRPYRKLLLDLRSRLSAENLVIPPSEDELAEAWTQYSSERYGTASLVDITSFIVMRRLGITEAFTNDQHFKAAGLITLF